MDNAEMAHRRELLAVCERVLNSVRRSDYTTEELEELAAIFETVGQRCITKSDEDDPEDEAEDVI